MINNILIAAAAVLPAVPLCAPILAEEITSPNKTTTIVASTPNINKSAAFSSLNTETVAPSLGLHERAVTNNIACRNAARSKFFELGGRDLSASDNNAQWAVIGGMRAVVWCRETRAIISVAGSNYNSVAELRDEIAKAF